MLGKILFQTSDVHALREWISQNINGASKQEFAFMKAINANMILGIYVVFEES